MDSEVVSVIYLVTLALAKTADWEYIDMWVHCIIKVLHLLTYSVQSAFACKSPRQSHTTMQSVSH